MKDSFKYTILLLLISFVIASLCCNSQIFEPFSSYPFDPPDDDINSLKNIQSMVFKYNEFVTDTDNNQEHYNIDDFINQINKNTQKREGIKYNRLLDSQPLFNNYMPFESKILSSSFDHQIEKKQKDKKIKGEEIKIDIDKKSETLLAQNLEPQVEGGIGSTQGIKERNDKGEIFYKPNKCIGEWSEWNTDTCGSDRNRCGIMFKNHTIISSEIVDENGPGRPCDYKDGITKYKYCNGNNADDLDSNLDRCDMPNNVCPCKLNSESSMILDGENVYDLENDDCPFELELDCNCPKGYTHINVKDICQLTEGVDCSLEEPGCIYTPASENVEEKCEMPTFINKTTEDNFFENYNQVNGKCKKKECICPNGTPISEEYCFIDGYEICDETIPCNPGYYMSGNPPRCEKQNESDDPDVIVFKQCSCLYGVSRIEELTTGQLSRCDPNNDDFSNERRIRQHCGSTGCEEGYRHTTGPECNDYYIESLYDNLTCCVPKYDKCILDETDLEERKIARKNKESLFLELTEKTLSELKDIHNEIETLDDITADELLEIEGASLHLIEKIIEYSDTETDEQCVEKIYIDQCYSDFECSPGYSFLPSTEYTEENELRMVNCEIKNVQEFRNICKPLRNCLGRNVKGLELQGTQIMAEYEGDILEPCKFSSEITSEELVEICEKTGFYDLDCNNVISSIGEQNIICGVPGSNNTCETGCILTQLNDYYPSWNGTCVPISCEVKDEIKEVYNISSDNCTSGNYSCGLNNISCKNDDFNIPNSKKNLYCPSPYKVDSNYLTNEYELIDYGCQKDPPEPTDPIEIRNRLRASEDASLASQRSGPNQDNIGNEADFTGSTRNRTLELETDLEEARVIAGEIAEDVGGGVGELTETQMANAASERLSSFGSR